MSKVLIKIDSLTKYFLATSQTFCGVMLVYDLILLYYSFLQLAQGRTGRLVASRIYSSDDECGEEEVMSCLQNIKNSMTILQ